MDEGVEISKALRKAMGDTPMPGKCHDCGGNGKVPAPELCTKESDAAPWKDCPTCGGSGLGGVA